MGRGQSFDDKPKIKNVLINYNRVTRTLESCNTTV